MLWREKLSAQAYTPPFVAGKRVFVLAADRSVAAFDGQTGRKLWTQPRPGEPLVLRQAGVLLAVGDTLVVGQGGRMAGLNPPNGSVRWEVPIASPRGTNDVERLVDLVGPRLPASATSVCARAFQAAVGCVDADARRRGLDQAGQRRPTASAATRRSSSAPRSDGRVVAWRRDNGERSLDPDKLMHRGLTAPLAVGARSSSATASASCTCCAREDGRCSTAWPPMARPIAAAPVVAGNTMVVVTRNGGVFGFVPQ